VGVRACMNALVRVRACMNALVRVRARVCVVHVQRDCVHVYVGLRERVLRTSMCKTIVHAMCATLSRTQCLFKMYAMCERS
jgi:hypothetical protein